jgi:uncharacterized membrane protein YcaP (DUF421 family)
MHVDWHRVLIPNTPLLEIFIRGTIVYLVIFVLFRIVRRQAGSTSFSDLLVIVMVADAAQNAMADDYQSIPDGLLLVATLVLWDMVINWLSYQWPAFERFTHPKPLPIIRDGSVLWRNLRQEMISQDELMSQIRQQGLTAIDQVKAAFVEGNGQISVIPKHKK